MALAQIQIAVRRQPGAYCGATKSGALTWLRALSSAKGYMLFEVRPAGIPKPF